MNGKEFSWQLKDTNIHDKTVHGFNKLLLNRSRVSPLIGVGRTTVNALLKDNNQLAPRQSRKQGGSSHELRCAAFYFSLPSPVRAILTRLNFAQLRALNAILDATNRKATLQNVVAPADVAILVGQSAVPGVRSINLCRTPPVTVGANVEV